MKGACVCEGWEWCDACAPPYATVTETEPLVGPLYGDWSGLGGETGDDTGQ